MPEVFDWKRGDPREVLQRAVKELTAGRLVVFPTQTGYQAAASVLCPDALAELSRLTSKSQAALAVRSVADAVRWAPFMSMTARRLARRVWPGPVIMVLESEDTSGDVNSRICLRVDAHEAVAGSLELLESPLVMAPLPKDPLTVAQIVSAVGESIAVIIDEGPPPGVSQLSEIRVRGNQWTISPPGTITEEQLRREQPITVLFVCTGNTCRSPLAQALCKKLLAERIGCRPDELSQHGFEVYSAGLAAMSGLEASAEAVATASELGADLSGHQSQPLTADLLARADHLFTMTQGHLRALLPFCPEVGTLPRLLAGDGRDVADPIGAEPQVYRECARQILKYLEECLPEIQRL